MLPELQDLEYNQKHLKQPQVVDTGHSILNTISVKGVGWDHRNEKHTILETIF